MHRPIQAATATGDRGLKPPKRRPLNCRASGRPAKPEPGNQSVLCEGNVARGDKQRQGMSLTPARLANLLVLFMLCASANAQASQPNLRIGTPTRNGNDCASVVSRQLAEQYSGTNDRSSTKYTDQWVGQTYTFNFHQLSWVQDKPLGDCFFKRHQWLQAKTAYEAAVADQANYPGAMPADELAEAYRNLASIAAHFSDSAAESKYTALLSAMQAKIANQPLFQKPVDLSEWPGYTKDEVRVIEAQGGTPQNVEAGLPCHHEIFTSGDQVSDTWWYCDAQGDYSYSFTFVNGVLQSTYQP